MIRQATHEDFDFIFKSIVESEKSGGEIFPYTAMFSISEEEFKKIVQGIFEEEIEDTAWHFNHWLINEKNGIPAAALCCWEEGKNGLSSDIIQAQTLGFFLQDKWHQAQSKLGELAKVSIPRKKGYIQLEHLYTKEEFRGQGVMKELMNYVFHHFANNHFEIQVLKENRSAVSLYEYIGFSVQNEKCNPAFSRLYLLSGECKLQLTKEI